MEKKKGRKKKVMDYNSPFAARFRDLLDRTNTTQPALAEAIGVSRQAIGQWKDGNTFPDVLALTKIADYFKVSADYLLGRTDHMTTDYDMKVAEKVTGLSEKSISNLQRMRKGEQASDPNVILESSRFAELSRYVSEARNTYILKIYVAKVASKILYDRSFYESLKAEDESERELMFQAICSSWGNLLGMEDPLGIRKPLNRTGELDSEQIYRQNYVTVSPEDFDGRIDIAEYRAAKALSGICESVKANVDYKAEIRKLNREARNAIEYVAEELEKLYSGYMGKSKLGLYEKKEMEEIGKELKAVQYYLANYDEEFKLKETKGENDNGSNNLKKE